MSGSARIPLNIVSPFIKQVKSTVIKRGGPAKDKEKLEKRILEELTKIFTETDSFFFCQNGDITNSLQRQCAYKKSRLNQGDQEEPLWKRVDDRFFWNKHMLQDIIDLKVIFLLTRKIRVSLVFFV